MTTTWGYRGMGVAYVFAFLLCTSVLTLVSGALENEVENGIYTDVGVLPHHVARESTTTEMSSSLLDGSDSPEEGAIKLQRLQDAIQQDGRDKVVHNLFVAWSRQYNRTYNSIHESTEALQLFERNVDNLATTNVTDLKAYWADKTPYRMRRHTPETRGRRDKKKLFMTRLFMTRRFLTDPLPQFPQNYPAAFNHRDANNLSAVNNQGLTCGSCWANSVTSAIDAAVNIFYYKQRLNSWKPYKFSRQVLVDCCTGNIAPGICDNCDGCHLGSAGEALNYAAAFTMPLEKNYPYISGALGEAGNCNSTSTKLGNLDYGGVWVKISGVVHYTDMDSDGVPIAIAETDLMSAVWQQPVVIYWSVGTGWITWAANSGIYDINAQNDAEGGCWQDYSCCDHAMLLVGYDQNEGDTGTWTIMNSWGKYWGENGFFRAQMTQDYNGPCGMYNYVVAPSVDFAKAPGHRPPTPNFAPPPGAAAPKPSPPRVGPPPAKRVEPPNKKLSPTPPPPPTKG